MVPFRTSALCFLAVLAGLVALAPALAQSPALAAGKYLLVYECSWGDGMRGEGTLSAVVSRDGEKARVRIGGFREPFNRDIEFKVALDETGSPVLSSKVKVAMIRFEDPRPLTLTGPWVADSMFELSTNHAACVSVLAGPEGTSYAAFAKFQARSKEDREIRRVVAKADSTFRTRLQQSYDGLLISVGKALTGIMLSDEQKKAYDDLFNRLKTQLDGMAGSFPERVTRLGDLRGFSDGRMRLNGMARDPSNSEWRDITKDVGELLRSTCLRAYGALSTDQKSAWDGNYMSHVAVSPVCASGTSSRRGRGR